MEADGGKYVRFCGAVDGDIMYFDVPDVAGFRDEERGFIMSKYWTKLEEVRMFLDRKTGDIKVTSSDPRFEGESFTLRISPDSLTEDLARGLLAQEGIEYDPQGDIATRHTERFRGRDKAGGVKFLVGWDGGGNPHYWLPPGMEGTNPNLPPVLHVLGNTASGKTSVLVRLARQAAERHEDYDTFVYSRSKGEWDSINIPKVTFLSDDFAEIEGSQKPRIILVDEYTTSGTKKIVDKLVRLARSNMDIIILASHETGAENRSNEPRAIVRLRRFDSDFKGAFTPANEVAKTIRLTISEPDLPSPN